MKFTRKIMAFLLILVLSTGLLALPAYATTTSAEHDGLEITVEMDKEEYEKDESITATITVKNTSKEDITILNLEQLIPEGYELAEESEAAKGEVTLRPGRKVTLKVTMDAEPVVEEETEGSFLDTLLYGKTWGIPNLLLALAVILAIVIFFVLT